MTKKLDQNITTIADFEHATKGLRQGTQIYVQLTGLGDDDSTLIEITELQLILPKNDEEVPYLVMRCA